MGLPVDADCPRPWPHRPEIHQDSDVTCPRLARAEECHCRMVGTVGVVSPCAVATMTRLTNHPIAYECVYGDMRSPVCQSSQTHSIPLRRAIAQAASKPRDKENLVMLSNRLDRSHHDGRSGDVTWQQGDGTMQMSRRPVGCKNDVAILPRTWSPCYLICAQRLHRHLRNATPNHPHSQLPRAVVA